MRRDYFPVAEIGSGQVMNLEMGAKIPLAYYVEWHLGKDDDAVGDAPPEMS